MSEQPDEDETPVESGSLADNLSFVRPDHELEMLVAAVNEGPICLGVTLVVGGQFVSGELISFNTFWQETADDIQGWNAGDGTGGAFEHGDAVTRGLADAYRERTLSADDEDDSDDAWPPRYIHLRNAVIHHGTFRFEVRRWRGRLALVAGWSFGQPS